MLICFWSKIVIKYEQFSKRRLLLSHYTTSNKNTKIHKNTTNDVLTDNRYTPTVINIAKNSLDLYTLCVNLNASKNENKLHFNVYNSSIYKDTDTRLKLAY